MTAPETARDDLDEPVVETDELEDAAADADDDEAGDELSEDETERLQAGLQKCAETQPTVHLLNHDEEVAWYGMEGSTHFMHLGGHDVLFDPDAGLYTALDPEPIRQLLVAQLQETHGEAEFDVGGGQRALDWTTVRIESEGDGLIQALVTTADGAVEDVPLQIDLQWQVTVGPTAGAADDEATEIDGAYLGTYYGDSEFPFDGRDYVIDWTTWDTDQTTDEGLVGSSVRATSAGEAFQLYAWFDPEVGIEIVESEPAGDTADGDEPEDGITAQYLGDYYGDSTFEFDGADYVIDWTTWDPDQTTDDGQVGSTVNATDGGGKPHELYVWFSADDGAVIAEATPLDDADETDGADDGGAVIEDPKAHFDEVLTQELRDVWAGNGNRLTSGSDEYDVSAWVAGEYGGEIEFTDHDGKFFYATLTASTVDDEPKRVRCSLRIRDADDVVVESTEDVS